MLEEYKVSLIILVCLQLSYESILTRVSVLTDAKDHSDELRSSYINLDGARILMKGIDIS